MKFLIIVALLAFVYAQSVPDNILDQFEAEVEDHNVNLRLAKDKMINMFLKRTQKHVLVYRLLKTDIVQPLNGINRSKAIKINTRYNELKTKMDRFFKAGVLTDVLNGDFKTITSYINNDFRTKVENFTESSTDPALLEKCWNLSQDDITAFFKDIGGRLSRTLAVASLTISNELDVLEVTMKEAFAAHKNAFTFCNATKGGSPCVRNYVILFFPNSYSFQFY